ncbi:MAG TPA: DUF389 domain-containing protein [Pseudolysinimonas sp.]|nr:DUF389 domain-containing protein [Pseudolysinimonas sp.]
MMHLRLISPPDLTDGIVRQVQNDPGTANLVVHRGAAVSPAGDVIICDVVRESASALVERLEKTGLAERGAIALDEVAVTLSAAADRAELLVPGDGSESVVWEQLEQRSGEETHLSPTFLVFISVAAMIAALGVLLDQPILIVGAMVVGPEFGPLAALCVGIIRGRPRMIGRALLTLLVGFAVALAVTILFSWVLAATGLADREQLLAARPLTSFIWRPDAISWVVATLAGVAGMLSLSTAKSGALVGVLISVTTIPAAANAGLAIAYGVPDQAAGAASQLGINLAAIVVGGAMTLGIQRILATRALRRRGRPPGASIS